jgi:CO/xanthine dehydrogenase FAD-binding subunit
MYVPEDLDDLLQYIDAHQSGIHIIANGSDLINRIQRGQVKPKVLVDLSALYDLNYVVRQGDTIRIGALTTISDLISSTVIDSNHDVFREVAVKFGGPSIVNVATVGGNICAASSSEDLLPVLLVLDARVLLRSKDAKRVMRLEEFMRGKRSLGLQSNEILVETMFEAIGEQSACAFEKIGIRNSMIIALVNCAVFLTLDQHDQRVREIRIAFNRVAGKIPQRARATEEKLRGCQLSDETVKGATQTLESELTLAGDFRVSGQYRTDVACTLFKRALERCAQRLQERP